MYDLCCQQKIRETSTNFANMYLENGIFLACKTDFVNGFFVEKTVENIGLKINLMQEVVSSKNNML